ncbi:MAG: radical SAM protein [Deltaproteobacteria bacterium]|nr:radical SAM protein [Deltaproteobacteria bacterium]
MVVPSTDPEQSAAASRPRLLLIFPPQWTPQNPHFALTSLAGHLRSKGYAVDARDLNILFYAEALTRRSMEWARERALLEHKFLADKLRILSIVQDESLEYQLDGQKALAISNYIETNRQVFAEIPDHIECAVATLRDPEKFYDPEQFTTAMDIIEQALEIYSLPYWPSRLQFNYFEQPYVPLNLDEMLAYVCDDHGNMFRRFFEGHVERLAAERPTVLGISINAFSQLLPGLTLAYELKKRIAPDVHLNIGGNFFTRLVDNLRRRPAFFDHFCHSVGVGEGERPLCALLDAVAERRPLDEVPNLIYPTDDGGAVRVTPECEPEPLESRGFHDLSGLPLELYLTPELVVCLEASKGCYWGKCTFCDSFFGVRRDQASVERVVAEVRHLGEKWNIRHFEFADECMTPQFMERLAERLAAEQLDVTWLCNGRLERTFDRPRLDKLYAGGLRLVLWGFESGSQRIMDMINKGVDFDGRWQVLRDATAAGIWNNAYIFFGFPTETAAEAELTIDAISGHVDLIHSYGRSVFTLGKQSLLREEASKFGIVSVLADNQEFSTNLCFKASSGMTEDEARQVMRRCSLRAAAAYGGAPLWMFLRYREDLHLYIAHYGREFVRGYQIGERRITDFENVW